MPENLRVAMRRNVEILKEYGRQAEAVESTMERIAERAAGIGDRLAEGLQRAVAAVPAPAAGDGGGGGAGESPGSEPAGGGPPLPLGFFGPAAPVSGGRGGGSGGNRGGFQRVGEPLPGGVSGGGDGASGAGGGSFQRVEGAARATAQAVQSLDSRSVPLLSSIDVGIRRLGDRMDRLADFGLLSRAD